MAEIIPAGLTSGRAIVTRFLAKYGTSSPVGAQLCVIAARAEREDSIVVARWVCAVAARSQKVGKCGMFYATDKRRVSPPQGIVRLAQAVKWWWISCKETVNMNRQ